MFSGIVQGKGKVSKITTKKDHLSCEISFPKGFNKNLKKGASISVNGVCLTSLDDGEKNLIRYRELPIMNFYDEPMCNAIHAATYDFATKKYLFLCC